MRNILYPGFILLLVFTTMIFTSCLLEDDEHCDYVKTIDDLRNPSSWGGINPIFYFKRSEVYPDLLYLTTVPFGLLLKTNDVCSHDAILVSTDIFIDNSKIYLIENGYYKFYLNIRYGPKNNPNLYSKAIRVVRKNLDDPVLRLEEYPLILFGVIDDLDPSETHVELSLVASIANPFRPDNLFTYSDGQKESKEVWKMVTNIDTKLKYTRY